MSPLTQPASHYVLLYWILIWMKAAICIKCGQSKPSGMPAWHQLFPTLSNKKSPPAKAGGDPKKLTGAPSTRAERPNEKVWRLMMRAMMKVDAASLE